MSDLVARTLQQLSQQVSGRLSLPGDSRYAAATAIWAKPAGPLPQAVVHAQTSADVQAAIHAARDSGLPLSVRGGGHDWARRALCAGIVVDLGAMRGVIVKPGSLVAHIAGGSRAADVALAAEPFGLAPVAGSVGDVGMAGFTLGGGYGALIGRCGLGLDNLLAAEVVLADGRVVLAKQDQEVELFWALRGGGGNFGVVTRLHCRLHDLPGIHSGLLLYPFPEAKAVLARCNELLAGAPDELTVQLGFVGTPDGTPMVFVFPSWCGRSGEGEARLASFLKLGTLLGGGVAAKTYGDHLRSFDGSLSHGQRVFIETCWLPALEGDGIDALVNAMGSAPSAGCAIATHELKGAATRVPLEATAFGLRREHVLVEIIAGFADRGDKREEQRHQAWARATRKALEPVALPGGYPNLLGPGDADRVAQSFGRNAARLAKAKRQYDPDNLFRSAIPLPKG
ncbi:6-hydroxy-D-nicotine oxidase [Hypericibacter adhaerens]|uniref:6-hydroxy-D-nicotine oxidase n=1 Tax=Hypericibacter adhaerens TaxID=2602016 RepID=A0A5J6MU39_9PROT|nr:FAD-binding oxidoreductase [Hypericibacter adhaerens]QEX20255.1 6-hydroxy-D-nicotine oxidase [Hypericibacter adhaerens]